MLSKRIFPLVCVMLTGAARLSADPLDQWNVRESVTPRNLFSVAHRAGQFVAVGQWGIILASTNGVFWEAIQTNLTATLNGVAWGVGSFVAVGDGGTILTSPDARSWTPQNSQTSNALMNVKFIDARFFAVGADGTILTSPDGAAWTSQSSGSPMILKGIAAGNGLVVACGGGNTQDSTFLHSFDGIAWTNQVAGYNSLYDLAFGRGRFVAMGIRGRTLSSTDAIHWASGATGNFDYLFSVTFAHETFVAAGGPYGGGGQKIATSTDGLTWLLHPIVTGRSGTLRGVTYGNGSFVAVGDKGLVIQSAPHLHLAPAASPTPGTRAWTLSGEVGRSYRLQFSGDPAGPAWNDLTNFVSVSETTLLTVPDDGGEPHRFYRAVSP